MYLFLYYIIIITFSMVYLQNLGLLKAIFYFNTLKSHNKVQQLCKLKSVKNLQYYN